jgi:uracil-DNA glycosylase
VAAPPDSLPALGADVALCRTCPRLVEHRERVARERRRAYRDEEYWGRPLMGFGDPSARLLLVGLAPAAHGGNRTGRMFTGDRSGDFLVAALHRAGLASQPESRASGDGLELRGAYMTAVVRCAPPANRPLGGEEAACRPFLRREIALLPEIRVVLALGRIAWDGYAAYRRAEGLPAAHVAFGHGCEERLGPDGPDLLASYHPSQQNTQTGRLTEEMMDAVLKRARQLAGL